MNYIIDYYFDLQTIDNENIVDILKNIIDSNNISNEPLDYQFEILDNENESIIFKGGEPTTTIPYRYFEEVADYLTHRKREAEEERISFLDSLFKPTKPTEEEVEVSTDVSEPTPPIIEESLSPQPPTMMEQPLSPQPPMMEQPLPQQPLMYNQIYKGGNVKSSIITVRIIIQKMKSLPFLFLKKMRYNLPK